MKTLSVLGFIFLFPFIIQSQSLKVSADGHKLVKEDGSAFFYMGDTAWELFHRCSKEKTEMYLKDRKAKGFNVIQAFVPPSSGAHPDWVLVLDDASKKYPDPATVIL